MLETSMAASFWSSLTSWFTPTALFLFLNLTIATIVITSKLHKQPHQNADGNNNNDDAHQAHPPLARSPSTMLYRLKSLNFYSYNKHQEEEQPRPHQQHPQPPLSRSPSVLGRLKSFNLHAYFSQEPVSATAPAPASASPPLLATQETVANFSPKQEEDRSEEELEDDDDQVDDLGERSLDEVYSQLQGKQVTRSKSDTKPTSSGEVVPTKQSREMKKSASANSAFSRNDESDVVGVESRRPATAGEGNAKKGAPDVGGGDDDHEVDAKADDFINRFKQQLKLQRIDSIIRYKEMLGRATAK